LDQFLKYHTKILFQNLNANVGRENIFKPRIRNENLHEIFNYNGVRAVNFAISKSVIFKSTIFPLSSNHKYTWTSHDEETRGQIGHFVIDTSRRRNSCVANIQ
jgi:hypothetical protein